MRHFVNEMYAFCFFVVLHVCPSWERLSVALPGGFFDFLSLLQWLLFWRVFLTGIKGLRTEVVVDFTDEQPTEPMVL